MLYREQWEKLLGITEEIRDLIREHDWALKKGSECLGATRGWPPGALEAAAVPYQDATLPGPAATVGLLPAQRKRRVSWQAARSNAPRP
jgi:hypothetical protein